LKFVGIRIRQAAAVGLLGLLPGLTGCVHTHAVLRTHPPDVVLNATLDQLLNQVEERYAAIHSMTLFVEMSTKTGGGAEGEVKETTSFKGYIMAAQPESIRVILQFTLYGKFLDMVSDGRTFKMMIPPKGCVIEGSDTVTNTTQKGVYSLRPSVILDSLLIQGIEPGQIVSMTQDSRDLPDPKKRKELIQDPDYDIEFLSPSEGRVARTLRVVHIDRRNLLPWRQDIYNGEGKIETQAFYSDYQKFDGVDFPTKIVVERPLDELALTITVGKGTNFNRALRSDEFDLGPIPPAYKTYNMDDPAVAAIAPCGAHVEPPTH
jgi:hypothetical protein